MFICIHMYIRSISRSRPARGRAPGAHRFFAIADVRVAINCLRYLIYINRYIIKILHHIGIWTIMISNSYTVRIPTTLICGDRTGSGCMRMHIYARNCKCMHARCNILTMHMYTCTAINCMHMRARMHE